VGMGIRIGIRIGIGMAVTAVHHSHLSICGGSPPELQITKSQHCNYCIFNFCVESFKIIVRTLCDNSGLQQQGFWPAFLAFSALVTANGQKPSTSGLDLILGRALIMSGCSTNCKLVR